MRYLYRVLRDDEIKNNKIKEIDDRMVFIESYVARNDSYKDSLISMTCSLEYAIGFCHNYYQQIPLSSKRIAVIDVSKLDESALIDVSSIGKYASAITYFKDMPSYALPPDAGDGRSGYHYAARAYEYLYLADIDPSAYRILTIEELQGLLSLVYLSNNKNILTENVYNYPILRSDIESLRGVYQLGTELVGERKAQSKLNLETRLKFEWLMHHAMYALTLGHYTSLEQLYTAIYGKNMYERYYPNKEELHFIEKWYNLVVASESYKMRSNIDILLGYLFSGDYEPIPTSDFKEICVAVHERSEQMFTQKSKEWIYV